MVEGWPPRNSLLKGSGGGMATLLSIERRVVMASPFYLNGNGGGTATLLFIEKGNGNGMATSQGSLDGVFP